MLCLCMIHSFHELDKQTPWKYQEQVRAPCYPQVIITLLSTEFALEKQMN